MLRKAGQRPDSASFLEQELKASGEILELLRQQLQDLPGGLQLLLQERRRIRPLPCLSQHSTLLPTPAQPQADHLRSKRSRDPIAQQNRPSPARLSLQGFVLKDTTSTSAA